MTTRLKKILISFICFALCLSLAACGGETEAPNSDDTTQTPTEDPYLYLYDGDTGVNVVYSPDADSDTIDLALKVAKGLSRLSTAKYSAGVMKTASDPGKVEILVGDVDTDETAEAYSTLGYGEAKSCVVGNKVVISGFDATSLEEAGSMFLTALADCKDENGGLRISKDYSETSVINEMTASLPVIDGVTPESVTDVGDDCWMLTFRSTQKSTADAYLSKLTSDGFTLYTQNTIDENYFYMYQKDDQLVTVAYTTNTRTTRILIEPSDNADLTILKENTNYTKGTSDVTLTQLGVAYADSASSRAAEYYTSGMSYVMRLDDGSFIIVDGGYDKQGDADRLYQVMCEQAGSDMVTVAAWIFTHAHNDHVEVISKFAKSYSSKVSVERFIYNTPGSGITSYFGSTAMVQSAINRYFDDAKVIKAHAGQKFYIRSAVIEMLYTVEIYDSTLTDYNNASLVFTVNAEDKQIMFLGDYYGTNTTLTKLYTAATLKSDVMQVGHHGISDGSNLLNSTVAPEYALWPVVSLQLKTYWENNPRDMDLTDNSHSFNKYFLEMDQNNVFVAGDDVVVMTLSGDISVSVYDNIDAYLQN